MKQRHATKAKVEPVKDAVVNSFCLRTYAYTDKVLAPVSENEPAVCQKCWGGAHLEVYRRPNTQIWWFESSVPITRPQIPGMGSSHGRWK